MALLSVENTIAELQRHIRELENQIVQTRFVVNSLRVRNGESPIYNDGDLIVGEMSGPLVIKSDEFYGQKVHTAMRQYLQMRKVANIGPATFSDLYKALCDGGLNFGTENEENRKINMRFLLRKNTSIFHRLPDGVHFGLTEWYPSVKAEAQPDTKKDKKKSRRSKARSGKPGSVVDEKRTPVDEKTKTPPPRGVGESERELTQEQAVSAAIDAMSGEFKKQDVVDWIDEIHPSIQAGKKRDSIFAMLAKLKDRIELVKRGVGSEPSTYRRTKA